MGSLFKSPSVPQYAPVTYNAPPQNSQSTAQPDSANESVGTTESDNAREVIRRTTRGRNSTIQTSYRGVLNATNTLAPQRKSLLGE